MSIITKYILCNIKERKFRTFLILLVITLSTSLFFASLSISDSVANAFYQSMKGYYGKTDVTVIPKDSNVSSFETKKIKKDKDIDFGIRFITSTALHMHKKDMVMFNLLGADYNKINKVNKIDFYKYKSLKPFTGKKIIISKYYSKKYDIKLGQQLQLLLKGKLEKFKVVGIAKTYGLFANEDNMQMGSAFVPEKTLETLINFKGKASEYVIKLKNNVDSKQFIKEYSKKVKGVTVKETLDKDSISSQTVGFTIPFLMITVLVLITSIFIIYTSFKVITLERLPILGTFRSIGATKRKLRKVLLTESLIYGVIGGALAIPLGIGILKLMLNIIVNGIGEGLKIELYFSTGNIVKSFLLAVIVSILSSYIPVFRTSRMSIKDIIFGNVYTGNKHKILKISFGIILLAFSLILPQIVKPEQVTNVVGLCLFALVIGFVLIIPLIIRVFIYIFSKIAGIFGNEAILGVKNMKDNESTNQNLTLLTIIVSTVILVFVLTGLTKASMDKGYNSVGGMNCYTIGQGLDNKMLNQVKKLDEVKKAKGTYWYMGDNNQGTPVKGFKSKLSQIEGAGEENIGLYDIDFLNNKKEKDVYRKLSKGRYIILSSSNMKKYERQIGDSIELKTPNGYKKYIIIAQSSLSNRDAYVSDYYMQKDFKQTKYSIIYVEAKHSEKAVKQIKALYGGEYNFTRSLAEEKKQNSGVINAIFNIMKGFAYVLLIIGFFGMVNNLLISFMQRRRSIAMYKSVGMSKPQGIKMFLFEGITLGIFGGIISCVLVGFEVSYINKIVVMTIGSVGTDYNQIKILFAIGFIIAVIISILGNIVPMFKSSKLEVIEALKYE